ncbi:MAG: lipoprotein-releasing system ATP-binding protein [Sphingobacteriales bacterium]|jgi:lipoprotein-releasing system ATP-binding protein
MKEVLLEAKELQKSFGALKILDHVNFTVNKGESVAITGSSGAGKTTLLNCISTLEKIDTGEIWFLGKDLSKLKNKALAQFRNSEIGFVFQFHHLIPELTALENVLLPTWIGKKEGAEERAEQLLTSLGLSERLQSKPATLSGGEKQRVAIARALINKPKILFADEPSGNLDTKNSRILKDTLFTLVKDQGLAMVLVTHDEIWAQECDVHLNIEDGSIHA